MKDILMLSAESQSNALLAPKEESVPASVSKTVKKKAEVSTKGFK